MTGSYSGSVLIDSLRNTRWYIVLVYWYTINAHGAVVIVTTVHDGDDGGAPPSGGGQVHAPFSDVSEFISTTTPLSTA